ncbi:MAG: hypothetical protein GY786_22710 [Proteobacteria bacterium]|nr:hypothetical protein [Pseudomonadota bacterium]
MKEEELVEKIERLEKKISDLEQMVGQNNSKTPYSVLKKRVLIPASLLSSIIIATMVFAATIPNSFTSGDTISSSAVNTNFSYIISRLWESNDPSSDLYYTAGNVGIGTSTPGEKLDIAGDGDADFDLWTAKNGGNDSSTIHIKFSRGTIANPEPVEDGDNLAYLTGQGFDGTDFQSAAAINFQVDGTPDTGIIPGRIEFKTTDSSGDWNERMRITSEGFVSIGSDNPSSKLYVDTDSGENVAAVKIRHEDPTTTESALDINSSGAGNSLEINTNEFVVDTNGNVGIGTNSPGSILSVVGLVEATSDIAVTGSLSGAVCITDAGNMYIDIDGSCSN